MKEEIWVCFITGTAPSVFIEPKHKIVREGKGLSLSCIATVTPKLRIKWKKNGEIIKQDNRIKIRFTDRGSKLRIKNLTTEDSGTYHCVAKNPHRPNTSGKGIVRVLGRVVFMQFCYTIFS